MGLKKKVSSKLIRCFLIKSISDKEKIICLLLLLSATKKRRSLEKTDPNGRNFIIGSLLKIHSSI
jgi:hypothetical protein